MIICYYFDVLKCISLDATIPDDTVFQIVLLFTNDGMCFFFAVNFNVVCVLFSTCTTGSAFLII